MKMRPRGVFGESCGRLEPQTRTKVDEDVAKGAKGDERRRTRGEGNHPEFADALANIRILRREAKNGRKWKNGRGEAKMKEMVETLTKN